MEFHQKKIPWSLGGRPKAAGMIKLSGMDTVRKPKMQPSTRVKRGMIQEALVWLAATQEKLIMATRKGKNVIQKKVD